MDLHRLRVFIVDDHDIVRIGLCTAISKLHCVVGLAGTVADALEQLPRTRPNVALVDFRLPDGTGVELCRQIRAAHPEIAVVLLSAYLSEDTVRSALAAGAAAYVTKASGLPELMGVLDALGQGAESPRSAAPSRSCPGCTPRRPALRARGSPRTRRTSSSWPRAG